MRVAVVGGGTMGTGIAYVLAAAGWPVVVVEPQVARARSMLDAVAAAARDGAARGKVREDPDALLRMFQLVRGVDEMPKELDVVVESVPERLTLKREVLGQIEEQRPALIATNTSALSIDELAAGLKRPASFLGMHFFNPVWSIPLVEIVRGSATDETALEGAQRLVEAIGKESVVVRDVPGFATSRLDLASALEAMRMLEAGVADAESIDRAIVLAYRHPVGPLRLSDIVGLDVRLDIARVLERAYGERFTPPAILEAKVAAGELGRKTGRGFFEWPGATQRLLR